MEMDWLIILVFYNSIIEFVMAATNSKLLITKKNI